MIRLPRPALWTDELAPRDDIDRAVRAVLIGLFVLLGLLVPRHLSPAYLDLASRGLAYSVAALSLVVLVGLVGQFSLAQAAFMGVGAFAAAHLVSNAHLPFALAVPLGGLAAVPVGMVAAIPALRVSGVYLAVVTLSFGQVLQKLFFDADVNGGSIGAGYALPRGSFLQDSIRYFWFEFGVLLALVWFTCMLRTRRTGRNLAAVRESEPAALSVGINLTRAKVTAFGLSAFIAGVGGVLYAGNSQIASSSSFSPFDSIALLSVAVIGGLGSAAGAVIAGQLKTIAPVVLATLVSGHLPLNDPGDVAGVLFGVGLVVQLLTAPLGISGQVLAGERWLAAAVRTMLRGGGRRAPVEVTS